MDHSKILRDSMDVALSDDMKVYNPFDIETSDNSKDVFKKLEYTKRAMKLVLTDRQRMCITMVYLKGMSQVEVADILGLSKSTVCRHIHSGLKKIRKFYALVDDGINQIEQDLANI